MYFEVVGFEGQDPKTFWDNLNFNGSYATPFERIAMVGDTPCKQLLPKFEEKFQSAEVRYFLPDQKEEALKWVNGKNHP